jgi:hypothetical protein
VLWQDEAALWAHQKFSDAMQQVKKDIESRNQNDSKMRTIAGSHGLPYTVLRPTQTPDVGCGAPCVL